MQLLSGGVTEDWRSTIIVPMHNGKGKRTEYRKFKRY